MGHAASRFCAPKDPQARLFKEYRIDKGKPLGSGGFGKCYRANDSKNRPVAAKVVKVDTSSARQLERLQREVRITQRARHECVVEVFGAGLRGFGAVKEFVIFLELCVGGELFKAVEAKGCLTEARARGYMAQLLRGVAHCHTLGIIHRDLKLENVLLTADGTLRIIDFGLAHEYERAADGTIDDAAPLTRCCGSRSYCAPEVLDQGRHFGGYSYKADSWSCGVCLFAMLLGFFPVEAAVGAHGEKDGDWRFKKLVEVQRDGECTTGTILSWYKKENILTEGALDLIEAILAIDQKSRLTAAAALEHAWVKDEPLVPARPSRRRRSRRSARNSRGETWASYLLGTSARLVSTVTGYDVTGASAKVSSQAPQYRAGGTVEEELPPPLPLLQRAQRFGDEIGGVEV